MNSKDFAREHAWSSQGYIVVHTYKSSAKTQKGLCG